MLSVTPVPSTEPWALIPGVSSYLRLRATWGLGNIWYQTEGPRASTASRSVPPADGGALLALRGASRSRAPVLPGAQVPRTQQRWQNHGTVAAGMPADGRGGMCPSILPSRTESSKTGAKIKKGLGKELSSETWKDWDMQPRRAQATGTENKRQLGDPSLSPEI